MAKAPTPMTLSQFYEKFGSKAFEAFNRQKNGKYNPFSKIILKDDSYEIQKAIKDGIKNLSKNVDNLNKFSIDLSKQLNLSNVLSTVSAVTGVLNLCATVAGFALVHKDLKDVKDNINSLAETVLDKHDQETFYKFDKMLGTYKNMLDRKKIGNEFSEDEYYELINEEQAILKLLITIFNKSTSNNKNDILSAIVTLASMFACTISNYDEVYYFSHKDVQKWHGYHDDWVDTYESLLSKQFKNELYDFIFIDENHNQNETDLIVESIVNSFKEAKQSIKDKQTLIGLNSTRKEYSTLINMINQSVLDDVKETFDEMNLSNNVQIQNLVKEVAQTLEMS